MTVAVELSHGSSSTSPDIKIPDTEQTQVAKVIPLFPEVVIPEPTAITSSGLYVPQSYWNKFGRFSLFQRRLQDLGIDPEGRLGEVLSINNDLAEDVRYDNHRASRLLLMSADGKTFSDSEPRLNSDNRHMLDTLYSLNGVEVQGDSIDADDRIREYRRHYHSEDHQIGFIEISVSALELDWRTFEEKNWTDFRVMVGSTALIDPMAAASFGNSS